MKIENIPNKNICFKKNILKGGVGPNSLREQQAATQIQGFMRGQQARKLLKKKSAIQIQKWMREQQARKLLKKTKECIDIIKNNPYINNNDVDKIKTYLSKNIKSLELLYDIINLLTEDNKHYIIQYILYLSTSNLDGGTELNKVIKFIKTNKEKKKYFEIYNRHILNYYDVDKFYNLYNKKIINYTMMQTYDETLPIEPPIELSNNAKKRWNKKSIIKLNEDYEDTKFENYLVSEFYKVCRNIITIKQKLASVVPLAPAPNNYQSIHNLPPIPPPIPTNNAQLKNLQNTQASPDQDLGKNNQSGETNEKEPKLKFDIKVIPSEFKGALKEGDFEWEIENTDKNPDWLKTLYIFNDNHNDHATQKDGSGNAVIRKYNKYGVNHHPANKDRELSKYPASAGICTGDRAGGKGYETLDQVIKGKDFTVRDQIDSDVKEIRELLNMIDPGGAAGGLGASGGPLYKFVKFSSDGKGGLGTSIFEVGDKVKDYIYKKIMELDNTTAP
uniref:Uncharacterized protein n=1 Tax=Florenciella sp. virus SA2 TaxID=3240092 RepID=A0AB39JFJ5_9VIRU